jgi:MFS superfamily sulfate permease-like transporter
MTKDILSNLKYDFPAGLVVFLVALPLCLGIALASGVPLYSGLMAGIIGGIVVGAISGSAVGASGPAAGLTIIVFTSVNDIGLGPFFLAVLIAGAMQIGLGVIKAGSIAYYFPMSVIKGMLASIGAILILKQIPHAVGFDRDPEGDLNFIQFDGENTFTELFEAINFISPGALIITAVCLTLMISWDKYIKPKFDVVRFVPSALLVVVVGTLINEFLKIAAPDIALIEANHMVSIPNIGSIAELNAAVTFPEFGKIMNQDVWITAVTIAIVASIETLLCVEATDKLDPHKRITPANRELVAQGVGNIACGLMGALPVTQVIVRSSANIDSGGRTKVSVIIHGILLFISVLTIPFLLNKIPLAALATILLVVGYKLAKVELFREMLSRKKEQYIPFLVTFFAILFSDLLIGIGIGMLSAIYFILQKNVQTDHSQISEYIDGNQVHRIVLSEEVSFLNKGSLQSSLQRIKPGENVIIDGSKAVSIPYDIYEMIKEFESQASERDIRVETVEFTASKIA